MISKDKILPRIFPFLNWLPAVNKGSLKADFLAGITGAVIVLPQGVAFAMIAGLPPEYGLYTAMTLPIVAALFGSSWHLISGPNTAISIVIFAAVSNFAPPSTPEFIQIALSVTFLAGFFQLALGLARMGTLVNFVSHTVVIAFTAGASILIITSQMKHVLGLEIPRGESFLLTWKDIFLGLGETNLYVLLIAGVTLLSAILLRKLLPKWPYMLFAMVVGSLLGILIDAEGHGVMLIGEIPAKLPPLSFPDLSLVTIKKLAPNAFAVALLGLIQAVSISRSIATKSQQHIDGNQEFIGQGLSNLVGSFFSSYAGAGSFTRSGLNYQAGAKTPMAAIFASILLALIVLLVAPLTAYLPMPSMGGIILLVAFDLVDFHHIKGIIRTSKAETSILLVTFLSTLFLELEFAIYVGVILSLIFYLQRTSKPRIVTMAPDPENEKRKFVNIGVFPQTECPQLRIIRIDGSLFFGAVNHVSSVLHEMSKDGRKHLLLVASGINFIDITGAEMLANEAKRWRDNGGGLYIAGLKKPGRDLIRNGGYLEAIGEENMFMTKLEAVSTVFRQLDPKKCASCTNRIFWECDNNPPLPPPDLQKVEGDTTAHSDN
jgi:SulP family sulfate permease